MEDNMNQTAGHPEPTAEQLAEATKCDEKAASCRQRAHDSFERCDTDGFVSQWASNLTALEYSTRATVLRQGGFAMFPGLYVAATGERVPAKMVDTKFGARWLVCDSETGMGLGEWLPVGERSRKLKKLGYVERQEWAPARVYIAGEGRGLSGTAWVATSRTDGGWPGAPRWKGNRS